mgnify:CR=1 FL=1
MRRQTRLRGDAARQDVFDYIERLYHTACKHTNIDILSAAATVTLPPTTLTTSVIAFVVPEGTCVSNIM